MKRNELEKLVGGYSAGNLTPQEEERLLETALQDQALFDELMEQQPLRELLADPEVRRELIRELAREPQPQGWRRWLSWFPARAGFTPAAVAAATVLIAAVIVQVGGWPERTSWQTVEVAEYRAPAPGMGTGESGGGAVGGIIGGMPQQAPPPSPPVSPRSREEALGLAGSSKVPALPMQPPAEPATTPQPFTSPTAKPLPERDQRLAAAPVLEPTADKAEPGRPEAVAPSAGAEATRRTEQAAAAVAPRRESADDEAQSTRAAAPRDAGLVGGVAGGIVGGVPKTAFPAATPPLPPPPAKNRGAKELASGARVTVEFTVGPPSQEAALTVRARSSLSGSFAVVRRSPNGVWQLLAPAEPSDVAPVLRTGSEAVLQFADGGGEAAIYLVFLPATSLIADTGPPQAAELLRGAARAYPQATQATGMARATFTYSATGGVVPSATGVLLVRLPQPQQTPQIR
jgi:hypothetical protein